MTEEIDTKDWNCDYVIVPVSALRVVKVDHEVVQWEASFCSEDAIPAEFAFEADENFYVEKR